MLGEPDTVSWDAVYERWHDVLAPLGQKEVTVPAVTGRDLRQAVAGMWSGVSEGPDGLTRGDLVRVPPDAWPEELTTGRVVSLPKSPDGPLVVRKTFAPSRCCR